MKTIDVRGLSCPEPLMMVADMIKSGAKEFDVLISEAHTKTNIENFLNGKGIKFTETENGEDFVISVK